MMTATIPPAEQDPRYSDPTAGPVGWVAVEHELASAGLSWLTTVRPDGRPHATPLITVADGPTVYFCTGPKEQKARNLTGNPHVVLTTGRNDLHGGLDVVVQGETERITDEVELQRLADAWLAKYGEEWHFEVGYRVFRHSAGGGGAAWVFAIRPRTIYGFGKDPYSQTRWRFA
jgi:general stress protein 26